MIYEKKLKSNLDQIPEKQKKLALGQGRERQEVAVLCLRKVKVAMAILKMSKIEGFDYENQELPRLYALGGRMAGYGPSKTKVSCLPG